MFLQHIILPCIYQVACIQKVNPNLLVFADFHNDQVPYSMEDLYLQLQSGQYEVMGVFHDEHQHNLFSNVKYMFRFMILYARSSHVFICDNFLPVSSCRKRIQTKVIQLWHGPGAFKKFGYDTTRDIPHIYRGNVYKNYNIITTSAPHCNPYFESAMRAKKGTAQALGISRSDRFLNEAYKEECRQVFDTKYPNYSQNKIALYAPSFRGNASNMEEMDVSCIANLQKELGDEWIVLIQLHPHMMKRYAIQTDIPTERLLPVVDVLITDYSSILFEYLLLKKPLVLYAPDLGSMIASDEFYLDYYSIPAEIVEDNNDLAKAVIRQGETNAYVDQVDAFLELYMSACDGHSIERLLRVLELYE